MNTDDLPSDSDQSDVDYVPSDCEGKLSEEDSDENISDEPQCQEDGGLEDPGKKRKKKQKKSRKSRKVSQEEEKTEVNEETTSNKPISAEEEKKRADSLWADFMKDVGGTPKKSEPSISSTSNDHEKASEQKTPAKTICDEKKKEKKEVEKENSRTVTEIFQFAGEEVRIQKEVASNSTIAENASCTKPPVPKTARGAKGGGLASVLGQLGKKPKLSVLEKSKLDWTEFKKDEGIEEEIQIHNKGKDGYLERQDFLQRADLRQFEIEKQLRANKRSYL